jgi:aspartate-semialdehyde dehydrogenase
MKRIRVGVLGATGVVGQTFVRYMADHPWFELTALTASDRSVGKPYREACAWRISADIPEIASSIVVRPCRPSSLEDCQLVFSALPGDAASDVEEACAKAGLAVSSNASAHRMDPDVPILVPEVNPDHLALIEVQRQRRGWGKGLIVTNPNCAVAALAVVLKPLQDTFGLDAVMVTTMQALSGAGYPGVPSLDALDNVIPYIVGEEQKLEREPRKILGTLTRTGLEMADFRISASCNRVATRDGHLMSVSLRFRRKPADLEAVATTLHGFSPLSQELGLPTAPQPPIRLRPEQDRPQPTLDRMEGKGMAVVVGGLRPCSVLDCKFTLLGHNLIRGAAGAALLNAELLLAEGYLG